MLKKLAKSIREYKTPSLLTSLFVFFEVVLEVLIPYIMAYLIDEGVYASNMNVILKLGTLLTFMALLSLLFGFLSGAFCAKEAVSKALKVGFYKSLSPLDIEILHGELGEAYIVKNEKISKLLNDKEIDISISHTKNQAIAICVIG